MLPAAHSSVFQKTIEQVEQLPADDQLLLVDIIRQRMIQHRRRDLFRQVSEAREAHRIGNVHSGSVDDLLRELDESEA